MKQINVVVLVEAHVVTGPAKNILRFAADCHDRVNLTVVTFIRSQGAKVCDLSNNQFVSAVHSLGIPLEIIRETGPFDLSVLCALRQILESHKADIVETHGIKSHFLVSLLPRKTFRWLAFHHGYTSEDLKMRIYSQFNRWSLRRCDLLVTVCEEFAKIIERQGVRRDHIFVVPNSVKIESSEASDLDKRRCRFKIPLGRLIVLAIGRLSPEKGHRYLIDAVFRMVSESPHLKFLVLIAGTGPTEQKLKREVRKRGLDQYVRFLGYCSDVRALFAISHLLVLPSLSEGSPNVLLESMAARVPIVATNVGGVPELVQDGVSSILVPSADGQSLARAITDLLVDRSRATQLADAAFDRARLLFEPRKHDERILKIYMRLMNLR